MKTLLKYIGAGLLVVVVCLLPEVSFGQLLQPGDAVVTFNPGMFTNSGGLTAYVLSISKTNNTLNAPLGYTWLPTTVTGLPWHAPALTPIPGTKSATFTKVDARWTYADLGTIFGITIDLTGNIYVSSTNIYATSTRAPQVNLTGNLGKIFKIDATTGNVCTIYNFTTNADPRSLGNLKYKKIGRIDYIYVTNFYDGKIYQLTPGVLASGGPDLCNWVVASSFDPAYGAQSTVIPAIDGQIPYGLAIRNMPGGSYRLYYSRVDFAVPANNNQIWSIGLNPNGTFASDERLETFAAPNTSTKPISDIAFTASGTKMIFAQQTLTSLTCVDAHASSVYELMESTPQNWVPSGNTFPTNDLYGAGINSAGGVSYSNHVLLDSNVVGCDTSVYLTNDAIYYSSDASLSGYYVYGVRGYKASTANTGNQSVIFDIDDQFTVVDKSRIGDIEVYNPEVCSPCTCGTWDTTTLNGNPLLGPLQFVQGHATGLLHFEHHCTGSCEASYTWSTTGMNCPGNTIVLENLNKIPCGNYDLTIKAVCGTDTCLKIIPIVIVCPDSGCCQSVITVQRINETVSPGVSPDANPPYSVFNGDFALTSSTPISEIRVDVDEYRLIASSPFCIVCGNRPNTWGNILAATYNGTPFTLSGFNVPPTGNLPVDYREGVYTYSPATVLNGGNLHLQLSLPMITNLPCCQVKAFLCLKFTFKDAQCRECVQEICDSFIIAKGDSCACTPNSSWNHGLFIGSGGPASQSVGCGGSMTVQSSSVVVTAPAYTCTPGTCNATYVWFVNGAQQPGNAISNTLALMPGSNSIMVQALCGGKICAECSFTIRDSIPQTDSCKCGTDTSWINGIIRYGVVGGIPGTTHCGGTITGQPGNYSFTMPAYTCSPNSATCQASYKWFVNGTLQSSTTNTANLALFAGTNNITIQALCGGRICAECKFTSIDTPAGNCNCNPQSNWKAQKTFYNYNQGADTGHVACGATINGQTGTYIFTIPNYSCLPVTPICGPRFIWKLNGVVTPWVATAGTFVITTPGTYVITVIATCGGVVCDSCVFTIQIPGGNPVVCDCGYWNDSISFGPVFTDGGGTWSPGNGGVATVGSNGTVVTGGGTWSSGGGGIATVGSIGGVVTGGTGTSVITYSARSKITCGSTITVAPGSYSFNMPNYTCNPNTDSCKATYQWNVDAPNSSDSRSGTGQTFTYNFAQPGSYTVILNAICGTKNCPCWFIVNVQGVEPPCCDYITAAAIQSTLQGQYFNFRTLFSFSGPVPTFSKVKVQLLEVSISGNAVASANIKPLSLNGLAGTTSPSVTSQGNAVWFASPAPSATADFYGAIFGMGAATNKGQVKLRIRYTFYKSGSPQVVCERDIDFTGTPEVVVGPK